ncbi:hypothetical protein NQP46_04985 [Streptomyces albus]|nr:hypothetical protein NQP46_04985 [Streptomyces albus]
MCLDVGNGRENGDAVAIYRCAAQGHANQNFVIQRGQFKVGDTL